MQILSICDFQDSLLSKLTEWIRANKLSQKKNMLFSNTIEALPTNIIFDDTPLERVSDIKFLGVTGKIILVGKASMVLLKSIYFF